MATKDPTDYTYLDEVAKQTIPGGTKKIGMFFPEELTLIRDRGHYLYDPRVEKEFDEDIVKGIMEIGLSKSIDAQKIRMDDGTCILAVTDGRQGIINTLEANRRLVERGDKPLKVKVEVREEDETLAIRRMVINNEHVQLDDPVTKGFKANRLKERGVPVELICQDFRCVPETLSNWINLTKLCVYVQKLVQTEKLAMTAALKLRSLSPTEQKVEADKIVAGVKKSSRGAGNEHKGVDKRRIKRLHELLGTKNEIVKRVFDWLVGNLEDDSVKDLINFDVLLKDSGKNNKNDNNSNNGAIGKRGRKKRENQIDDTEQNRTLAAIFGHRNVDVDGNIDDNLDEADGDLVSDEDLACLVDDDGLDDGICSDD